MLVLTRQVGEKIRIGDDISFVVLEIHRKRVRIGIEAPDDVAIVREEILRPKPPALAAETRELELSHAAGNL